MKNTLVFGLFLSCALAATAQGQIEFTAYLHGTNVVPSSPSPYTGEGSFSLSGTLFSYEIRTPYLPSRSGTINGPTAPGMNAPVLFDLIRTSCTAPLPPWDPGQCIYQGEVVILSEHIPDLMAGLWYVQVQGREFPHLAMRGQIEVVPEPSAIWLLAVTPLGLFLAKRFLLKRPFLFPFNSD